MPERGCDARNQMRLRLSNLRERLYALPGCDVLVIDHMVQIFIDDLIDDVIEMIRDSNSYVRTRGLTLIACNAKWYS